MAEQILNGQDHWFGENRLHIKRYHDHTDAWLLHVPVNHAEINHINSLELESRMKQVDWQTSALAETHYSSFARTIVSDNPKVTRIDQDLQQLYDAEQRQGTEIARSLQIKFWTFTEYSDAIHPAYLYHADRMAISGRFGPGTTPEDAYRVLKTISQEQRNEKIPQQRIDQAVQPDYIFYNFNHQNINEQNLDYLKNLGVIDTSINFYELKQELAELGLRDPGLVDDLRSSLLSGKDWFSLDTLIATDAETLHLALDFNRDADGCLSLEYYNGVIGPGGNGSWRDTNQLRDQVFYPDVPLTEAHGLLQARLKRPDVSAAIAGSPMTRQEVRASLGLLLNPTQLANQNTMNTENLDYLKKNLLNLGFGEKVNDEMEKLIKAKVTEFSLTTEQEYNGRKMDYTLHFKAGDQNDMYFLNRYEAHHLEQDRAQTLYINKGHGVTAKEAFNLLEGRSVEKKLYNKENEPYTAWLKLDFKQKDERGNHMLNKFSEGYGYDLEKTLSQYPVKELDNSQQKEELLRSLRKGNAQQVTIEKDGNSQKYYLAAEPQYKQINIYDSQLKSVKRESLRQDNSQEQSQKQSRKNGQDENSTKQSRKQKVH